MGDFSVKLTAEEAVRLDGFCAPEVQVIVDRAKTALSLIPSGLSEKEGAMVATILSVAKEKGRLTYSRSPITNCPCCGRHDGYFNHARTGRYHRKGQPNYSAPKTFMGFNLDQGFVTVQHHISVGFCTECQARVEAVLLPLLHSVETDCPDHWTAAPHRYRRFDNKVCTACGWEGHEGEMRRERTLMGDGSYPAGCPKCPAVNAPLGRTVIDRRDGFALVARGQNGSTSVTGSSGYRSVQAEPISTPPPPTDGEVK